MSESARTLLTLKYRGGSVGHLTIFEKPDHQECEGKLPRRANRVEQPTRVVFFFETAEARERLRK